MATKRKADQPADEAVIEIPDDKHPDYQANLYEDGGNGTQTFTPGPDGPGGIPIPLPEPFPDLPHPLPDLPVLPFPLRICFAVSGRYVLKQPVITTTPGPIGGPIGLPVFNLTSITVRVDVDRFFPQKRISVQVVRLLPRSSAHVIAEVTSDRCLAFNKRRVEATITYRDGSNSLIPGDKLVFEAGRGAGIGYGSYKLTVSGSGTTTRTYDLEFQSQYFDDIEFEVDRVSNANLPTTSYGTHTHPNRPATLPNETISFETVYKRAGFNVSMSPNTSVIPATAAGTNGTWSDSEMHNAMATYWSRFADKPQWAMWILFAKRHDDGRDLGGVMFDDIGPNHRQGTSIFTDSFIQDAPAGDANAAAWRNRMVFWTAVHEMGHAFNLAHSWQKALAEPFGNPWIPLVNQPEARSFMNYPFRVSGGQSAFFANFDFRFTNEEMIFMRHAPRRFVQMGNENWFTNHNFEQPVPDMFSGRYQLEVRPNREINTYSFLEPVKVEIKLTNTSSGPMAIDEHLLEDGAHILIFVQRDGGTVKKWQPMIIRCHDSHNSLLPAGESLYGQHLVSTSTDGWLIDEPGFYNIQSAVDVGDEVLLSNVLRIFVSPSTNQEENKIAPDYFTEDVGRVLAFDGAPTLEKGTDTLKEVADRLKGTPAAMHATKAVSAPLLRFYKQLDEDNGELVIKASQPDINEANKQQTDALLSAPDKAADTFGHISYFKSVETLADALNENGDKKEAKKVLTNSVATMKKRQILPSVVQETEAKLANL